MATDPMDLFTPAPLTEEEEAAQMSLFDAPVEDWTTHWKKMPDFNQEDLQSDSSVKVHFANKADREAFGALIGRKMTEKTRSIWYPEAEIGHMADRYYESTKNICNNYPIYIISKGRWDTRLTARSLESMNVDYKIVVEPQEFLNYASVIDPKKILQLPFSNLGQGSIPARNWVWDHACSTGAARHWIMDDNINGFFRLHKNIKTPVSDGAIFKAAEDFCDRYENVTIAGFNYFMFARRRDPNIIPFRLNTRIYSCILLRNDLDYRWRGRYNEDTDLSIRILKDGHCSVLFNAFLCGKSTTMTMSGGNSDQLYQEDGRLKMAESLREQHPDVVTVTRKWDRWQHHVDYSKFKTKLRPKPGSIMEDGIDDYGMSLKILDGYYTKDGRKLGMG